MEDVEGFFFPIEKAEKIAGFLVELVSKYQEKKKKPYQS